MAKLDSPTPTIDRLLKLAHRIGCGKEVTSRYIRETFGVSRPTAQRDLVRLECALPVDVAKRESRAGRIEQVLRLLPD